LTSVSQHIDLHGSATYRSIAWVLLSDCALKVAAGNGAKILTGVSNSGRSCRPIVAIPNTSATEKDMTRFTEATTASKLFALLIDRHGPKAGLAKDPSLDAVPRAFHGIQCAFADVFEQRSTSAGVRSDWGPEHYR
jgi:hypothetical protein